MSLTIGSLFDGIGGFPLAGERVGMKAVWASEIEKFPIEVTKIRFPDMKHYGDITKINGAEVEPVDVVTGGSPCQDLSVAGKRAGMAGARSGLFMEMIRVIKEMRDADKLRFERGRNTESRERSNTINAFTTAGICGLRNTDAISTDNTKGCTTNIEKSIAQHGFCSTDKLSRPRYMLWENVPGAFSSNKGEDFRAVLEETARIADETASIPRSANGRWSDAGLIMADNYSIAWRVFDAQYWGVPQRRRRIYLVADFAGQSAGKILFEREGLSRHIKEGGKAGQGTAAGVETGIGKPIAMLNYQGSKGNSVADVSDKMYTLNAMHGHDVHVIADTGSGKAVAIENHPADGRCKIEEDGKVQSLTSRMGTGGNNVPLVMNERQYALTVGENIANTLTGTDYKGTELAACVNTGTHGGHGNHVIGGHTVRRLTPLECERLQDYPDGWTDIPGASDSARYKALGNSIAVCCAEYVLEGIREVSQWQ